MGFNDIPALNFEINSGFERVIAKQQDYIENIFNSDAIQNVLHVQNMLSQRVNELLMPLTKFQELVQGISTSLFERANFANDFMSSIRNLTPNYPVIPLENFFPKLKNFSEISIHELYNWKSGFDTDVSEATITATDSELDTGQHNREVEKPHVRTKPYKRDLKQRITKSLIQQKTVYNITTFSQRVIKLFILESAAYGLWGFMQDTSLSFDIRAYLIMLIISIVTAALGE